MSFIYAFLVICVAALSFLTFYYWQMSRSAAAILREGARRFNELAQHRKKIAGDAETLRIQLKSTTAEKDATLKQLTAAQKKLAEQDVQLTKNTASLSTFANQNDHLKIQVEALTEQIKELERRVHTPATPKVEKQVLNQLEEKYKKTTTDYQNAMSKLTLMERQYRDINPEELRAYKKRCAQFNRMYHGMRSLKEMAEQKTENFEVALLHLSRWVLQNTKGQKVTENFGEIVGEALERTGGSLIEYAPGENEKDAESAMTRGA